MRLKGDYPEGIDLLSRAAALHPSDPDCLCNLGNILGDAGFYQEAISVLERCLDLSPNFAQAKETLGWDLFQVGEFLRAEEVLVSAVESNPALLHAWINLGNVFKVQERFSKAINSYRKAIEVQPDFAEAYLNLALVLKEEGEVEEAIASYRKAIEVKPDFAEAYLNLGIILKEEGEVEEAVASYRRAIEVKCDFAEAYLNLGIALSEEGDLEKAIRYLLLSININPTQRIGFFGLFNAFSGAYCNNETALVKHLSVTILQSSNCKEIIAFGDSHVGIFDDIPGFEKVWVGAATAYNLIKSQSSTKGREKIFKRLESAAPGTSAVLLSFGEVDCRSNILKYCVKSGKSIDEVCADVVSRYFEFVEEIAEGGFAVVLCGPYGSGSDHNNQGNAQERYYASVCIEERLRLGAKERGIPYFSLHGVMTDAALQKTRLELFDDGLHFPGHKTGEISSEVKCMVLSRMLEAVNESHAYSVNSAPPEVKEISLIGENCLCLLDVFSDDNPMFHRLGLLPDASARVEVLSQACKSIVIDLGACLNVEALKASFPASNAEGIDVWGLDNSGNKADAVIKVDSHFDDELAGVRLDAVFSPRSMLRYLVVTCPEGLLSSLLDFDVRGQSFVFS